MNQETFKSEIMNRDAGTGSSPCFFFWSRFFPFSSCLKFKVFKGSKVQALYFAPTISLDFISLMKFVMAAESFLLSA